MERKYWLKSVGSASDEEAADWPDSGPRELSQVHFANRGKPSVQTGDYLVYYASDQERLIAIVEVFGRPARDSDEAPWACEVRPRIILRRIHRSPALDTISDVKHNSQVSRSHVEITKKQYLHARAALEAAFDKSEGDILADWPMFETALRPTCS